MLEGLKKRRKKSIERERENEIKARRIREYLQHQTGSN
jgi:hypothetical protein